MTIETTITTDAVSEPISRTEAKLYLKLDNTADDDVVDYCISAARRWAENYTGLSFAAKTYTTLVNDLEKWEDEFELPYSPTASITSVHAVDYEGTESELVLNTGYYKRGLKELTIRPVKTFSTSGAYQSGFKIVHVSGTAFNEQAKVGMLKLIADFYENRQNERDEASVLISYDAKAVFDSMKKIHFI